MAENSLVDDTTLPSADKEDVRNLPEGALAKHYVVASEMNPMISVIRDLRTRAQDVANVKNYGATGDGETDDTEAVQAAIDAAATDSKSVFFPPGTYAVSNLQHGSAQWVGIPRKSVVTALDSGDADYLVASPKWLELLATTASTPFGIYGIDFNAGGFKDFTLALRTYFTRIENCRIQGATDTDLLFSTDAQDGTGLSSTMVNNEVVGCWIGVDGDTAQYGLRTIDTNAKATDYHIIDNYFSGASVANLRVEISSGWNIRGNHFYGAPSSAYVYKPNVGTRFVDNYCEDEVRFGSPVVATDAARFGPGNYFADHVWADFNAVGNYLVLLGNQYKSGAELRHCYFSASKVLVSQDETFHSSQPFAHYASAGGSIQNTSTGKFHVIAAHLTGIGRTVSAMFDGSGASTAGIMRRQTSWDSVAFNTVRPPAARVAVTYSASMTPSLALGDVFYVAATNSTNFTVNAPAQATASGQRITIQIANTSGGALGTATWAAGYKMASWTQPADGSSRSITFAYDGTNWIEVSRTPADVPN